MYCILVEHIVIPPTVAESIHMYTHADSGAVGFPLVPVHDRIWNAPFLLDKFNYLFAYCRSLKILSSTCCNWSTWYINTCTNTRWFHWLRYYSMNSAYKKTPALVISTIVVFNCQVDMINSLEPCLWLFFETRRWFTKWYRPSTTRSKCIIKINIERIIIIFTNLDKYLINN